MANIFTHLSSDTVDLERTCLCHRDKWFTTALGKRRTTTGWECRGTQPERAHPPINTETGTGSTEPVLTSTTGIRENQTPTHNVQ